VDMMFPDSKIQAIQAPSHNLENWVADRAGQWIIAVRHPGPPCLLFVLCHLTEIRPLAISFSPSTNEQQQRSMDISKIYLRDLKVDHAPNHRK
jgi:hypothetical protein